MQKIKNPELKNLLQQRLKFSFLVTKRFVMKLSSCAHAKDTYIVRNLWDQIEALNRNRVEAMKKHNCCCHKGRPLPTKNVHTSSQEKDIWFCTYMSFVFIYGIIGDLLMDPAISMHTSKFECSTDEKHTDFSDASSVQYFSSICIGSSPSAVYHFPSWHSKCFSWNDL